MFRLCFCHNTAGVVSSRTLHLMRQNSRILLCKPIVMLNDNTNDKTPNAQSRNSNGQGASKVLTIFKLRATPHLE